MMLDNLSESASAADAAAERSQSAAPNAIARLVNLGRGLFSFSVTGAAPWRGAETGLALPAVHVCPFHADRDGAVEITTASGKPGAWLGGQADTLFVRSPAGGSAALVTAYLGYDPSGPSLALAIRRLDGPSASGGGAAAEPTVVMVPLATSMAPALPQEIGLEILLHIRGRGDVYFFEPGWAGRVGAGSWVEAFAILPQHALAASAIEYKGLSASGVETAWLPSGSRCGTSGRSTPLLGFAVRQKAGVAGARFDCEYSGYFESGTISGPARNGAPCLSTAANDPLEGLQLRIIDRSVRE
jgi:hypothetical protein